MNVAGLTWYVPWRSLARGAFGEDPHILEGLRAAYTMYGEADRENIPRAPPNEVFHSEGSSCWLDLATGAVALDVTTYPKRGEPPVVRRVGARILRQIPVFARLEAALMRHVYNSYESPDQIEEDIRAYQAMLASRTTSDVD